MSELTLELGEQIADIGCSYCGGSTRVPTVSFPRTAMHIRFTTRPSTPAIKSPASG